MKKLSTKLAMRKFVGISAMALMLGTGMNFVSCSSDDDSDEETEVQVENEENNSSEDDSSSSTDDNSSSTGDNSSSGNSSTSTDDSAVYFSSMTFADVEAQDFASATEDYVSSDGTWRIVHGVSTAKVSEASAKSYDEAYSYTKRIQMKGAAIKLLVGAGKTAILRVDGGSASGTGSMRTLTAGDANWTSYKGSANGKVAAGFLSVTGDSDGYVTLSADSNINIYGIHVVSEAVDLSAVELGTSDTYGDVAISKDVDEVSTDDSVTLSASVEKTSKTIFANGLESDEGTTSTVSDFNFYLDGSETALESATNSFEKGDHTVKAVLFTVSTDADGNETKTENSKVTGELSFSVIDANAIYYTVTFDANGGNDGSVTSQSIESGVATALSKVSELGLSKDSSWFINWNTSADGTGTSYSDGDEITITGDITLYAQYQAIKEVGQVTFNSSLTNTTSSYVTIAYAEEYTAAYKDYKLTLDGTSNESSDSAYLKKGLKVNGSTNVTFTFNQKTKCVVYMLLNNAQGHGFTFANADSSGSSFTSAYSDNTAASGVKAVECILEAGTYTFTRDGSSSKEYSLGGIVFSVAE